MIDRPNAIGFHLHGPGIGFRHKGQNVQMIQRFPHGRNHRLYKSGIDIRAALVRSVLGVSDIIHWRAVENHIVRGFAIPMNPADVVIHLNPIVQFRGGISEENFIRPIKPQHTVGLFLANEMGIFCKPFVDNC